MRLKEKNKSHGKVLVAVARKMLEVVLVLLTRDCDCADSDEVTTRRKTLKMDRITREMRDVAVAVERLSDRTTESLIGDYDHKLTG